jgi:hypothetical protein
VQVFIGNPLGLVASTVMVSYLSAEVAAQAAVSRRAVACGRTSTGVT